MKTVVANVASSTRFSEAGRARGLHGAPGAVRAADLLRRPRDLLLTKRGMGYGNITGKNTECPLSPPVAWVLRGASSIEIALVGQEALWRCMSHEGWP